MDFLINFMAGNVNSQTAQAGNGTSGGFLGGGMGTMLIVFAIFFVVLYFFSIRPQKKREKQQKEKLASIKKGDRVQTIGGWRGTVAAVKETTFILRLEDGAKIEVVKSAVSDVVLSAAPHGPSKASAKDEETQDAADPSDGADSADLSANQDSSDASDELDSASDGGEKRIEGDAKAKG